MNKTKQRIKIAEACGWKDIKRCARKSLKPHPDGAELRGTLDPVTINYTRTYSRLPDYLNDLNAMHEAEEVIKSHWDAYFGCLIDIRWRDAQSESDNHPRNLSPAAATPEQRAEAFLRVLGLWEEKK